MCDRKAQAPQWLQRAVRLPITSAVQTERARIALTEGQCLGPDRYAAVRHKAEGGCVLPLGEFKFGQRGVSIIPMPAT